MIYSYYNMLRKREQINTLFLLHVLINMLTLISLKLTKSSLSVNNVPLLLSYTMSTKKQVIQKQANIIS